MNKVMLRNLLEGVMQNYYNYLSQEQRVDMPIMSGDWDSGEYIRSSHMNQCPKYIGMVQKGLIFKKEVTFQSAVAMEDGTRRAQQIYESILWGIRGNVFDNRMSVMFEARAQKLYGEEQYPIAGTTDILINWEGSTKICVEIKKTSARSPYKNQDYLFQLGMQMVAHDAKLGALIITYSDSHSDPYTIWVVEWRDGNFYVYDTHGEIQGDPKFYSFEDAHLKYKIGMHNRFMKEPTSPAPYARPDWCCGKITLKEYYKVSRGTAKKGEAKPNTGIIEVRCPAFEHCFGVSGLFVPCDEYGNIEES